jgi:hypothetical protein
MAAKRAQKTVRFDVLVKGSGQPEQVTLWTKPEADREFMKAVNAGQVVTVIQHNVGTKKDYGVVGFSAEKNAAYLVFPKTLEPEEGTKVIGIKYERVAAEKPKGPIYKPVKQGSPGIPMRERPRFTLEEEEEEKERRPTRGSTQPAKRKAPLKRFAAQVRITATQLVTIEIEAKDKVEARKKAEAQAKDLKIDVSEAEVRRTIKGPSPQR